jgi:hypothetical protein
MSDSISKYKELMEEGKLSTISENQRGTNIIVEIVQGASCAGNLKTLLQKTLHISNTGPNLLPSTVFQIAADEAKVDELCDKQKLNQWNSQD